MATHPKGTTAVIFVAQRTAADDDGYARAATEMSILASQQPGFLGMDSVRDEAGLGITISYSEREAHAKAWRDHGEHKAIRDAGRDRWYRHYSLHVSEISRSYDWTKP